MQFTDADIDFQQRKVWSLGDELDVLECKIIKLKIERNGIRAKYYDAERELDRMKVIEFERTHSM